VEKSIEQYQASIKVNPDSATAWAKLARAYFVQILELRRQNTGHVTQTDIEAVAREARAAIQRALEINSNLAIAHSELGLQLMVFDWNWTAARTEYQRALDLNPGDATTIARLARLAEVSGHLDEAIELCHHSLEADPLVADHYYALGHILIAANRFDEAEVALHRYDELHSGARTTHYFLGVIQLLRGRHPEALGEFEKVSDEPLKLAGLSMGYWALGRRDQSDLALTRMEKEYGTFLPANVAIVHAYRGDTDAAFDWLDRAYRQHDGIMIINVKKWPLLRSLHGDPRYRALLGRMKLDDE
jgi:tetratricopeptide (TPR) repeat protein